MGNVYHRSDPLRNRVYDWEDGQSLAVQSYMTLGDVRRWVRKACRYYKVKPPTVQMAPDRARLSYSCGGRLFFVPIHRNPIVALHEVAHHICDTLLDVPSPPALLVAHSDEWFSIYMWLLLKFGVYEAPFLRASLKPYRLRLRALSPETIHAA